MNMNQLAKEIARREGGKKNINIAQIKEIVGIISDLVFQSIEIELLLIKNGKRRAKRKKK